MTQACAVLGLSRQAFNQHLRRQQKRQVAREMALALVQDVRRRHPYMGIRKVVHMIRPQLRSWDLSIGRDVLFALARERDLLVRRRRNPRRTTHPGRRRYPNLLAQTVLTRSGQAWVADITYLYTEAGHRYSFLLMDACSRYIVGWTLSPSLAVEGALEALTMAQHSVPPPLTGCIHHSDHGVQDTARTYQAALQRSGLQPSMGQVGNA